MFHIFFRLFRIRTKSVPNVLWTLLFLLVVYLEAVVYFVHQIRWPDSTCGIQPNHHHKVLLVADPQILGEATESWIARWDCDRFLSKTFKLALEHVEPSLVIFLGDLMDEGSIASPSEYLRYYQRFNKIFRIHTLQANQTIYLPGDNDIGGENEDVTPQKLNRFDKYFGLKPDVVFFENVKFSKVNFMLKTSPKYEPSESDINLSIIISHMSLLGASSFFTEKVIRELKPSLIISAHDHKAVHFVGDIETGERTHIESMLETPASNINWRWRFQTSKFHTNEIVVPTCSYRMGTRQTGYGVLLIDSEGDNVCYSVLWLPDRLLHLKIYFFLIFPSLTVYLIVKVIHKSRLSRSL
uniref:Cell division control protein 1 n=1 Tax=Lygus hesperus TaxID=30085 RepID=A0A146LYP1_LYGHE